MPHFKSFIFSLILIIRSPERLLEKNIEVLRAHPTAELGQFDVNNLPREICFHYVCRIVEVELTAVNN